MGMVGGYVLHLYCDGEKCQKGREFAEFGGQTAKEARLEARKAGWKIIPQGEGVEPAVIGPRCVKEGAW